MNPVAAQTFQRIHELQSAKRVTEALGAITTA
jgi:hypothetical protein